MTLRRTSCALAIALAAVSCHALFQGPLGFPSGGGFEGWLFRPDATSPWLCLTLAGWLWGRRRARLAMHDAPGSPVLGAALLLVAAAGFVWARLVHAEWLLLPALAATCWAFAALRAGVAGLRAMLLPGLVLLLGAPLPVPVHSEAVWALQRWTATGSAWLLSLAGQEITRSGVVLFGERHAFLVVEECSGLRGLQILTVLAFAIRELYRSGGPRVFAVIALAPPLGLALNVVRVAAIAGASNPRAAVTDHTLQGIAVLASGTALLYATGWGLARGASRREAEPTSDPTSPVRPNALTLAWWAAMALVALLVPVLPTPERPPMLELPERLAGWTSTEHEIDPRFQGVLARPYFLFRRYERRFGAGTEIVELFGTYEVHDNLAARRYFSRKIEPPAADWQIAKRQRVRIWDLGVDGVEALAVRPLDGERALVHALTLRSPGFWIASLQSFLAWERTPFAPRLPRLALRLATPIGRGGREQARAVLDRFESDFATALSRL